MPIKFFNYVINFYQKLISPFFPPTCRFYPSCSDYALMSLKEYGLRKGIILIIIRLFRCQPLFAGGIDFPERMAKKIWKTQKG